MNVMLDLTGASFVDVATNVTETLAQYSNVPMGYPLEEYVISTEFNPDGDPSISDGRVHKGIDLSTRSQILPISATAAGTVVEAAFHNDYGYYVKIDHGNGFTTLYAHNSENLVEVGDTVKKGDKLLEVDINTVKAKGYSLETPVLVTDADQYADVVEMAGQTVKAGEPLLTVLK